MLIYALVSYFTVCSAKVRFRIISVIRGNFGFTGEVTRGTTFEEINAGPESDMELVIRVAEDGLGLSIPDDDLIKGFRIRKFNNVGEVIDYISELVIKQQGCSLFEE